MGRNSSTRPARFLQAVDGRRVRRGRGDGPSYVGSQSVVGGENGVVGNLGGHSRFAELCRRVAIDAEIVGRRLRLASCSVAKGRSTSQKPAPQREKEQAGAPFQTQTFQARPSSRFC